MVKTLGFASVLAFSLATTGAFAQSAPATTDAPMQTQTERLNTQSTEQPATTTLGTLSYIPEQMSGEVLSSTLISKAVYNPENEELGKVNQLVMNSSGQVVAVVIGVGGFLGMGEKDVAVPFSSLQQTMQDGDHRLTLQTTKADLEQAPAYKTLEDRG